MSDFDRMQTMLKDKEEFSVYCGDGFNEIKLEEEKVSFVFNEDGSLYYVLNYKFQI